VGGLDTTHVGGPAVAHIPAAGSEPAHSAHNHGSGPPAQPVLNAVPVSHAVPSYGLSPAGFPPGTHAARTHAVYTAGQAPARHAVVGAGILGDPASMLAAAAVGGGGGGEPVPKRRRRAGVDTTAVVTGAAAPVLLRPLLPLLVLPLYRKCYLLLVCPLLHYS
jgi:hypothetical protein